MAVGLAYLGARRIRRARGRACAPSGLRTRCGSRTHPSPSSWIAYAGCCLQRSPPPASSSIRLLRDSTERALVGLRLTGSIRIERPHNAGSTYRGLLVVSVVAAVAAQARLLLGRPEEVAERLTSERPRTRIFPTTRSFIPRRLSIVKAKGRYAVLAVVAGACLLDRRVVLPTNTSRSLPLPATPGWLGRAHMSR